MANTDRPNAPSPAPPPFEVQIQRGHRAVDSLQREGSGAATATAGSAFSPVAQRRARTRRRAGLALGAAAALGALLLGVLWWRGQPPAGTLARVNGEYITAAQVDREILLNRALSALANNGQGVADTRTATLERLISERMLAQAITQAGAQLTEADLDVALTRLSASQQWSADQLTTALTRQGLSLADLRASIHDRVLINRYLDEVVDKGAADANQARARETTWRSGIERMSKVERLGSPEAGDAPGPGRPAPDFTLQDLDNRPVRLADLRGRPVLINFWATWCQPCRLEMPILVNRYRQIHAAGSGQDLEILAVAINSTPDTVAAFRQEFGLAFPVLLDTDNQALNLYRIGPIPTSVLIDRTGTVRWIQVGMWTDALLQEKLQLIP